MIALERKDLTPALMSFLLLLGIVALAIVRHWRIPDVWVGYPVNVDTLFVSFYVLWILVETPIAKRDVNTEGKTTSDFATCQIYGLGQALTFLSAIWFPSVWHGPGVPHVIGICLFFLAVCYRLWAIRTLGRFYSHRVRTVAGHRVVDSGPYRFTRHPAYAGMIVANAGISLYFFNRVTIALFLFLLVPSLLLRIVIEERTLLGIEGYAEFAKKRKRLFPALW